MNKIKDLIAKNSLPTASMPKLKWQGQYTNSQGQYSYLDRCQSCRNTSNKPYTSIPMQNVTEVQRTITYLNYPNPSYLNMVFQETFCSRNALLPIEYCFICFNFFFFCGKCGEGGLGESFFSEMVQISECTVYNIVMEAWMQKQINQPVH